MNKFYTCSKLISSICFLIALSACGVENNITFSTTQGNCADGATNAPYCMAVTIQNNNGGQNYINSTNYPISNLTLSVSGANNVNYPTAQGSSYDPNNCLGSSIQPGSSCTFYLWLSGESLPVGSHTPITITANYTTNNTLPWVSSGNSASSSTTVYETPGLQISSTLGFVQVYNNSGFNTAYHAESGPNSAIAVANDNYYGFLYLANTNGIYFSGNGNYAGNASNNSSSITGATNLLINGLSFYATPSSSSLSSYVYSAGIQKESFNWSQYAAGLPNNIATNIGAINGSSLFFATGTSVYLCNPTTGRGNNCIIEGGLIPNATTINAINFTTLSTSTLTGVVVGANNGLWLESGILGLSTNSWVQAQVGTGDITTSIVKIVADKSGNLYSADANGYVYTLPINGTNQVSQSNWQVSGGIVAMVVDNSASALYIANQAGTIYLCPLSGNSCSQVGNSAFSNNIILGTNVITQLTSS